MVFTTSIFLFYFLPLVLLIYYLIPRYRNLVLLISSYIFYGWWNPWFVLLMFFVSYVNYICGKIIAAADDDSPRGYIALVTSVVVCLLILGFFKYFTFLQHNINWGLAAFSMETFSVWEIILPVGISFYIFQSISYTVDVYRKESPAVRSFLDFACYVALFPQLIAGPIVRYSSIAGQLVKREHSLEKFSSGLALFILGFAKKIWLANGVGRIADTTFNAESPLMVDAWYGLVAYAFQIYFDFSAYSDMAIGLGRMFGFDFLRNFNAPYLARSITDFWKRWHISLSTFLRDYLYIPLGGNRNGMGRTYINLTIVMLLGGLWHGASWVFVIWGAFHGFFLVYERWRGKKSLYEKLPQVLQVSITFVLVLFSWVFFRCVTLDQAVRYFTSLFGLADSNTASAILSAELYTRGNIISMLLCAVLVFQKVQAFDWVDKITPIRMLLLIFLFVFSVMTMFTQFFNPFLYFQF